MLRDGPAPLGRDADPTARSLELAFVIPQFRRGSGGHQTIANLVRELEGRHRVTLWLQDDEGRHAGESEAASQRFFGDFFGPVAAPLRTRFEDFDGADVAVATGWQTVPRVLSLLGVGARAYLVQDHEPEFYATSAERLWAEWTYRQGLHCLCASPWLTELVRDRYGVSATPFDLGVDHERYRPSAKQRRADVVLVYARAVTARRAVPLALLAMEELAERRPEVEIALFGEPATIGATFPHRDLGVLDTEGLLEAYSSATVGVVLSLTNPSLVTTEMLACGLPVVDVRSASMRAAFGDDGPIALAEPDPLSLCVGVERLLDDAALRAARDRAGAAFVAGRTWARAAEQVEAGLREAVRAPLRRGP